MSVLVDTDYVPSEEEPFMNERQKAYFRAKLITWKNDILREARETLEILQQENANHPDLADRASSETDRAIELRARDRQRKLISKIDQALEREAVGEGHQQRRHLRRLEREGDVGVEGLLGEGVAYAARFDAQAKALGEWLRARVVDLPTRFDQEGTNR